MDAADRILIRWHQPPPVDDLPAKCIAGRPFHVAATIFRDGHGVLRSRVRWRAAGGQARSEVEWSEAPMVPGFDDLFRASFVPTTLGLHEYVVEAWTSQFETWRRDIRLRASVGEDVEAELLEGAAILDRLAPAVPRKFRRRVRDAVTTLRSTTCSSNVRMSAGLDDAVAEAVATVIDPTDHTSTGFRTVRVERERAAVGAWYEFFPRSVGGFAGGAVDRLDAIADMGFDVVYLPPIHPIGVTNRKGRNNSLGAGPGDPGSPWAIGAAEGGHTAMHPELGTFDDFDAFVASADELGLEVALDYALQCSPDHPWVTEHPEWFHHLPDGTIRYAENPPKRYQDIHPINFWPEEEARLALWNACHEILEFWIGHGVRIFRVDNPHTKPLAFWAWLLPEVWADHPDVVFLAEAFTHPAMMHELAAIGFSQSYTYFTWRTSAYELRSYVEELAFGPHAATFRPNFWPNTPDILSGPLRNGPRAAFEIRAVLASLLAPSWGVYSGFELCENSPASPDNEEYHDSEKYRIVERNWTDPDSLAPLLRRLNEIRRAHRSVGRLDNIRFHDTEDPDVLAFSRRDGEDVLLVVVNLDPHVPHETMVRLDLGALGLADGQRFDVHDELSALVGESGDRWTWNGWHNYVRLDPAERVGHVFAVTAL